MDELKRSLELAGYTTDLRRWFHTWPECQPAEQVMAMAKVCEELEKLGIPYERVAGGGIVGFLEGGKTGRTLLMRADLDGLPIREDPENLAGPRVCVSKHPGVMHACGHDAHTAMLLTAARILKEKSAELPGRILLMFEEGEEGGGNIMTLCRWIEKSRIQVDGVYACHVRWDIDSGTVGLTSGAAMCGLVHFQVNIQGKKAHGSRPDEGSNAIDCFVQFCTALQSARMTHTVPDTCLTYSICTVKAGTVHNILPDSLTAEGTVRFTDPRQCLRFMEQMRNVAAASAVITGCTAEVIDLEHHYPVISDPQCMALMRTAAQRAVGDEHVFDAPMWMASESFSYLTSMYPGVLAFLGIRNAEVGSGAGHHTAKFDVDEKALPYGVAAAVAYARAFLASDLDLSGFRRAAPDIETLISDLTNRRQFILRS